jgi:hypothetical protein
VQLRRIGIAEVALSCPAFGQPTIPFAPQVDLATGVGPYNATDRTIHVMGTASSTKRTDGDTSPSPVGDASFKITVVGEFHVPDETKLQFPLEKLPIWAGRNGAAVLLPFLREQVYSLTRNTGFGPVLIPLLEVVPFKVSPPDLPPSSLVSEPIRVATE